MSDYRPWWSPLENGVPVLTSEGFALMTFWLCELDVNERRKLATNDFGNKFCIIEQFWAVHHGFAEEAI